VFIVFQTVGIHARIYDRTYTHALNCRLGVKSEVYTRRKFTGVLIRRRPSILCNTAEAAPAMIDCRGSNA